MEGMPTLLQSLDSADNWLHYMAAAADYAGIYIQYCMALPRHAMQALRFDSVTQVGSHELLNNKLRALY